MRLLSDGLREDSSAPHRGRRDRSAASAPTKLVVRVSPRLQCVCRTDLLPVRESQHFADGMSTGGSRPAGHESAASKDEPPSSRLVLSGQRGEPAPRTLRRCGERQRGEWIPAVLAASPANRVSWRAGRIEPAQDFNRSLLLARGNTRRRACVLNRPLCCRRYREAAHPSTPPTHHL